MDGLCFGIIAGIVTVSIIIYIIIYAINDCKKIDVKSDSQNRNMIEEVISEVTAILLKDWNSAKTDLCKKASIECRIFTLQYFRIIIGDSYDILAKEYEDAAIETYSQARGICSMSEDQFINYFNNRCRLYGQLHYDIAKKKREELKAIPLEYMSFRYLIYSTPLKQVNDNELQRNLFSLNNDFFVLISFSRDVTNACRCIYKKFADFINESTLGDDEEGNDTNNSSETEIEVARLLKEHGIEDAIDIVTGRLSDVLEVSKKDGNKSNDISEEISTYCEILDILSPLDKPHRYSGITDVDYLVEILCIEYDRINDAGKDIQKLRTRAEVRGWALIKNASGPKMNIDGNKLLREAELYSKALYKLLDYKRELGIAAMSKEIFRVSNDVMKSDLTYLIDGYLLGYFFQGKLYLNPKFPIDTLKGPIHFYTYMWLRHMKITNHLLYKQIIEKAMISEYFCHICSSEKFSDLKEEEAAVKAWCYLVASQANSILFNEEKKNELMSSDLARADFASLKLIHKSKLTLLPIISFIRNDKLGRL